MLYSWETNFIKLLQSGLSSFVIMLAQAITYLGEESVIVLIMGFIYWSLNKETGKKVALNILVGVSFNAVIKNAFIRPRPYMTDSEIVCLKPPSSGADIFDTNVQGHSFPSGHSTNSVTAYSSFAFYSKKKLLTACGIIIPVLVGFSRIVLGVHYPTDVLFGWILGLAVIFILDFLRKKIKDKRVLYGVITLVLLPGFIFCKTSDYFTTFGMLTGYCAGDLLESSKVRFEMPDRLLCVFLRPVLGILLFMLFNALIKYFVGFLPFYSHTSVQNVFRTVRYFITVFTIIGIYPLLFRKLKI
ncbi:MAG: phosphatase PAP2 family protein [Clostridia bacterium]|nr:phosphatase PAP2 family protein [Clostridia bacterium]